MEKQTLDYIQNFETNDKLGGLFGSKCISVSKEECFYEYIASPDHFNPNGILHGGALYTVMDSSQGAFIHYILEDIYKCGATGTATIRYLAPVSEEKIKIRTWLKEKDKRKYIICSEAMNESETIVATLEEIWIAILK
ncbi:PaaI family thioesterase [Leptospira ilyithenensis]|uniref:PaaI family thioesterase n=1 Tax=Leptospira ilyithenensis TaxID=2484901 RepID=A0A4R9LK27_9LEPT|nr:PaaI family thioesterase [Leptospira ilyithenensis]TGN07936.1 PaaI family thioesterase [Leptospira ilyithenensis]